MTALLDRFTVSKLSRHITEIVVAYLVTFIAFGGNITGPAEWIVLAQVILAIKLYVFALPLAFTPVLEPIPAWAWYVIVVLWLSKTLQHSGYTVADAVQQLEAAYEAPTAESRREQPPVETDGSGGDR